MEAGFVTDDVDLDAVVSPRPDLLQVEIDRETVLYRPSTGRTHSLNTAATAIWGCLDGKTSLRDLADDVVAVSGWGRDSVESELVQLVRDFGRRGLLAEVSDRSGPLVRRTPPDPRSPRFIPVTQAECARRTQLPWSGTRTVQVGGYLLGVRSATPELDGVVLEGLRPHIVDGAQAPPNYSLRLAEPGGPDYHRLLHACETPVRTRSVRRLFSALCSHLAGHAAEQDAGLVRLEALALVRDGEAALLPAQSRGVLTAEDELRRYGFTILDAPVVGIDPASGELVVEPPAVSIDDAVLAGHGFEPDADDVAVPPGRYPVRAWVGTSPGRAALVAEANRRVRNREAAGAETVLAALHRVAGDATPVRTTPGVDAGSRLADLTAQWGASG